MFLSEFVFKVTLFKLIKIIIDKYDQVVAALRTEMNKLVEDIREKQAESIEEAKRLRSATNDFIREKPFDFDPSLVNFRIRIKKPNVYVLLQGPPDSSIPTEFPDDIIWESDDDDESDLDSEYDYEYELAGPGYETIS